MVLPSVDFTFSSAEPLLGQRQDDMGSVLFSFGEYSDECCKDDFNTYINLPDYDDVEETGSPPSLSSPPSSSIDTDSDGSYPSTPSLEDDPSLNPSPTVCPSLLLSPSPAPTQGKVPTIAVIDFEEIDAEEDSDDDSEFDDSSDESFDPEDELRAARNRRKHAQQSRTSGRSAAPASPKSPRVGQYKSKQSSRRGSSSRKSTSGARSRSSTAASRRIPMKPRLRYCKPRADQVSVEQYEARLKQIDEDAQKNTKESKQKKSYKCPYTECEYRSTKKRQADLERHIDTHHQTARGTAFVCCGVPINKLPALLPKDGSVSVSDYQLYEYQGGLWAGGCFQVISRKDAMQRHWGLHAKSETDKKKKCKCIPTKEMVEINLHEHRLV